MALAASLSNLSLSDEFDLLPQIEAKWKERGYQPLRIEAGEGMSYPHTRWYEYSIHYSDREDRARKVNAIIDGFANITSSDGLKGPVIRYKLQKMYDRNKELSLAMSVVMDS